VARCRGGWRRIQSSRADRGQLIQRLNYEHGAAAACLTGECTKEWEWGECLFPRFPSASQRPCYPTPAFLGTHNLRQKPATRLGRDTAKWTTFETKDTPTPARSHRRLSVVYRYTQPRRRRGVVLL
jgi:hypothetical protein